MFALRVLSLATVEKNKKKKKKLSLSCSRARDNFRSYRFLILRAAYLPVLLPVRIWNIRPKARYLNLSHTPRIEIRLQIQRWERMSRNFARPFAGWITIALDSCSLRARPLSRLIGNYIGNYRFSALSYQNTSRLIYISCSYEVQRMLQRAVLLIVPLVSCRVLLRLRNKTHSFFFPPNLCERSRSYHLLREHSILEDELPPLSLSPPFGHSAPSAALPNYYLFNLWLLPQYFLNR